MFLKGGKYPQPCTSLLNESLGIVSRKLFIVVVFFNERNTQTCTREIVVGVHGSPLDVLGISGVRGKAELLVGVHGSPLDVLGISGVRGRAELLVGVHGSPLDVLGISGVRGRAELLVGVHGFPLDVLEYKDTRLGVSGLSWMASFNLVFRTCMVGWTSVQ